jgi:transmembrane sensor
MSTSNPAREQAEVWFARLLAPDVSPGERAAFERWRNDAPQHAQAFAATESLWQQLDGLEDDEIIGPYARAALEHDPDPMAEWTAAIQQRRGQAHRKATRRRSRMPLALVASLFLCAFGVSLAIGFWPDPQQLYQSGDRPYTVVLADGSRVQMDLATQLEVDLKSTRRDLRLLQGRAIFEVAHDARRPFVVDAGGGRITALGTRFQVDQQDRDNVLVTLVEGSIALQSSGNDEVSGSERIRLVAGEQASYSRMRATWTRQDANVMSAISWSEGFHVFSATPLAEAVKEINKYSAVKLRLSDHSLDGLVLSGNFKAGNAQNIAVALPVVLPVQVTNAPGEIVVSKR